jgi:DNA invertase Pin-like site-specific DNA recombinase
LTEAGAIKFFEDKISSRKTDRPGLAAALEYLRCGDVLAVWKLDRFGRSVKEILTLADELHDRGVGLRILTGTLAGTYIPTGEGKFFFTIMAAFAELERDLVHQRTMAGLAAARSQGRVSAVHIAKALGVSRATLYRHTDVTAARGQRRPS